MHPQAIGRGHRLAMVERLIEAAEALDGVVFERLGDFAARWRTEHPLVEWLRRRPGSRGQYDCLLRNLKRQYCCRLAVERGAGSLGGMAGMNVPGRSLDQGREALERASACDYEATTASARGQ